jgi:hypothetical protein
MSLETFIPLSQFVDPYNLPKVTVTFNINYQKFWSLSNDSRLFWNNVASYDSDICSTELGGHDPRPKHMWYLT